jgi:transcription initiation factor TFIID subunit 8
MPGAITIPPAAMDRQPSSFDTGTQDGRPAKRRRIVHHGIKYKQPLASEALDVVQDDAFFQSQLLRSISLALTAVGFDSVLPSALEAFRAEVEDCTSYKNQENY